MTPVETFTSLAVFVTLLWNVINEIRLRSHAKALQENEAHLRVTSELRLRLHQQSWDLLREIQDAAFTAFETIRKLQVTSLLVFAHGGPHEGRAEPSRAHEEAMAAVRKLSGLAHCAPPAREDLRKAASKFTKVFNALSEQLLDPGAKPGDDVIGQRQAELRDALVSLSRGTADWNAELWQHQTVTELARPG